MIILKGVGFSEALRWSRGLASSPLGFHQGNSYPMPASTPCPAVPGLQDPSRSLAGQLEPGPSPGSCPVAWIRASPNGSHPDHPEPRPGRAGGQCSQAGQPRSVSAQEAVAWESLAVCLGKQRGSPEQTGKPQVPAPPQEGSCLWPRSPAPLSPVGTSGEGAEWLCSHVERRL